MADNPDRSHQSDVNEALPTQTADPDISASERDQKNLRSDEDETSMPTTNEEGDSLNNEPHVQIDSQHRFHGNLRRSTEDFEIQMDAAMDRESRSSSDLSRERRRTERLLSADFSIFENGKLVHDGSNRPSQLQSSPPPLHLKKFFKISSKTWRSIILFSIWAIFTFTFISQRILPPDEHMVSVLPRTLKPFLVPNYTDSVSVTVSGPFLHESKVKYTGYDDPRAKTVSITVMRVFYDENMLPLKAMQVAKTWHEYLVDSAVEELEIPITRFVVFDLWTNVSRSDHSRMFLDIITNIDWAITFKFCYDWYPVNKVAGIILGALVLALMYIMIICELCSNTLIAILSSSLALAFISILNPPPDFEAVLSWIDMPMLMLLFSMMIIIDILSEAGAFDFITMYAYQLSRGEPWRLIQSLCLLIPLIAAIINNSATMMLTAPIIINLCEISALDPVKVLTCLVICANVGSSFSPIGSTPNVIVTNEKYIMKNGVNFANFVLHILPCSTIALLMTLCTLHRFFGDKNKLRYEDPDEEEFLRRSIKKWSRARGTVGNFTRDGLIMSDVIDRVTNTLQDNMDEKRESTVADRDVGSDESENEPRNFDETLEQLKSKYGIRNFLLLCQAVASLLFVITLFALRSFENLNLMSFTWAALIGALLLLVMSFDYCGYGEFDALLNRLHWTTLIFIASLFVMVEALAQMGYDEMIYSLVHNAVLSVGESYQLLVAMLMILWLTALTTILLNNNPVTTMMVRIVVDLSQSKELNLPLHPLVWALVLGASFGGNASIVSASPNIVTAGIADKHAYKFKYCNFFMIGSTITLLNLIWASIYLAVCHVVFHWH